MTVLTIIAVKDKFKRVGVLLSSDNQVTAIKSNGTFEAMYGQKIIDIRLRNGDVIGIGHVGDVPGKIHIPQHHKNLMSLIDQKMIIGEYIEKNLQYYAGFNLKEGTKVVFTWVEENHPQLKEYMKSNGGWEITLDSSEPFLYHSAPDNLQEKISQILEKDGTYDKFREDLLNYEELRKISISIINYCNKRHERCGLGHQMAFIAKNQFKWLKRPPFQKI